MAKIKIIDLACDMKISKEEMKKVFGGMNKTDLTAYSPRIDASIQRSYGIGDTPKVIVDTPEALTNRERE